MMANTIYIVIYLLSILITIIFVIGTHEFAHFAMARLLGVKILRFSIGFGKVLWRLHDRSGTEYVFSLLPLGGYVKMLDENEDTVSSHEKHRAFNKQPYYKKFLIVAAGPLMNLLCAALLYWLIFVIGFISIKPVIGSVTPDSIAYQAGLKGKQEIISINQHPTNSWSAVLFKLLGHIGDDQVINIEVSEPKTATVATHQLNLSDWQLDGLTPDPLKSLGITPFEPPLPLIIGFISENSPAASTLKIGDQIIALDGKKIKDWGHLTRITHSNPNKMVVFSIKRAGKTLKLPITLGAHHSWFKNDTGYLGMGPIVSFPPEMLREVRYPPLLAIKRAFYEVVDFTYFNLALFGKLLTGKLSLQTLGGPLTIFESAGTALNYGLVPFLSFLAFLSASVGVINLLPIPGLDGGHLLIETIECIIRRPLPQQVMMALYYAGFGLIIFVLVHALINDVIRLA